VALTVTRDMMNSYRNTVAGGSKPDGLYIRPMAENFIPYMREVEAPMADLLMGSGKPAKGRGKTTNKIELKFGEGDSVPNETTIAGAGLAAVAANTVETITVASAVIFQKHQLYRVSTERGRVLAVDAAGGTVTVLRGVGGSTPVAAAAGTIIYKMAPAIPEGADYVQSPSAYGEVFSNFCQIVEYTWTITHRGKITPDEEVKGDRFAYERKRKAREAKEQLDTAFLWGVPSEGDGTLENPSMMGGLIHFTTANSIPVTGALDLNDILSGLQQVYHDTGTGMGTQLMMGYKAKRIMNSFFKSNRRYTGGGDLDLREDGFHSDFGHITFKVNRNMKDDARIILINPSDWDFRWFEGGMWSDGLYSSDGWYDTGFLRCDLGAMFPGNRRRAMWHSFSLSDASYPNLDTV